MSKELKIWYLIDTDTHEVSGPYDIVESSLLSATSTHLSGHLQVAETFIRYIRISTVFMGVDARLNVADEKPLLFETKVLCTNSNEQRMNYASRIKSSVLLPL